VLLDTVSEFLSQALHCVLTIFRRDGAAQMSIVSCVLYQDGVGFTTSNDRAKLLNLWRYPHCSLLVSQEDWWGYVILGRTSPKFCRRKVPLQRSYIKYYERFSGLFPATSTPNGRNTTAPCNCNAAQQYWSFQSGSTVLKPRKGLGPSSSHRLRPVFRYQGVNMFSWVPAYARLTRNKMSR
jgi:hypothetical protein